MRIFHRQRAIRFSLAAVLILSMVSCGKKKTVAAADNSSTGMPSLSINSPSISEGDSGTKTLSFTVTQSAVTSIATTFNWATSDGTATAGSDYVAVSSTQATIPAGSTTVTLDVTINGDVTPEGNETFSVNLSNASGATIASATGTGTITNDDVACPYTFSNTQINGANFAITANAANHVYVSSINGIYKSTDAGASFSKINSPNFGSINLNVKPNGTKVYSTGGTFAAGLWISTDGGANFTMDINDGLNSVWIWDVAVDGSDKIYVATSGGVFISTNGGTNFTAKTTANGLASNDVRNVFIGPNGNIYAGGNGGVSVSTNGGNSWTNSATGLSNNFVTGLFVAANNQVYVSTASGEFAVSTDFGATFSSQAIGGNTRRPYVTAGGTILLPTSAGLKVSSDSGVTWVTCTMANGGLDANDVLAATVINGKVFVGMNSSGVSISQ